MSDGNFFTFGYERRSLEDVVEIILENGVEVLVDIRHRPQSRKKGLSKSTLSAELDRNGVRYIHNPLLGTPPEIVKTKGCQGEYSPEDYLAWLGEHESILENLMDISQGTKVALMCYERNLAECYRQYLCQVLEEKFNIVFQHIE